jgi:hypothetical protein
MGAFLNAALFNRYARSIREDMTPDVGSGSGSALNPAILIVAGSATVVATVVSAMSISLHLKNYRKPMLQRCVCPSPFYLRV